MSDHTKWVKIPITREKKAILDVLHLAREYIAECQRGTKLKAFDCEIKDWLESHEIATKQICDGQIDKVLEWYTALNDPSKMIPIMSGEFKLYTHEAVNYHSANQMFYIVDWQHWWSLSGWLDYIGEIKLLNIDYLPDHINHDHLMRRIDEQGRIIK